MECWSNGLRRPILQLLQHSITPILSPLPFVPPRIAEVTMAIEANPAMTSHEF